MQGLQSLDPELVPDVDSVPLRTRIVQWLTAGSWSMVLTLAVCKAAGLLAHYGKAAWAFDLDDPDNYMRLAQIRDWLRGQRWFDVTQYRADLPPGLHTHWSRISDLPTGSVIALLTPITGTALAEQIAVTLVPLALLVVTMLLIARIADALAGPKARFPAALIALYAVKYQWEFIPGRIDHHGLQIVLVLAAIAAMTGYTSRRAGVLAALAAALSLTVSLETAPYLAIIAAWTAMRWAVRGDSVRAATLGFFGGLAVLVPAVFAATVPYADWPMAKSDAIGRGHVSAAILLGGALALAAALTPAARPARFRWALVVGIAAVGTTLLLIVFPEVIANPYAMIGPMLTRLWLANIGETRTVVKDWASSPASAVARMAFAVAMVPAAIVLLRRSAGTARDHYALMTALAVLALALSGWHFRGTAIAAAVVLPVAAALVTFSLRRSVLAATGVTIAIGALLLADSLVPQKPSKTVPVADGDCSLRADFAELRQLPPGLMLAQINLSGALLVWTPHSVISSGVHRGFRGNIFAFETWMAAPAVARANLQAQHVRYVAHCIGGGEGEVLAKQAPHGLIAQLQQGQQFAWLQPVAVAANPRFKVYRFVP